VKNLTSRLFAVFVRAVVMEFSVGLKVKVSLYASNVNDELKELPTPQAAMK
jgi:hypothetical protein